jgi:hypothetical protein
MTNQTNAEADFSLAGILVALIFGYIAFKLFPVVNGIGIIYNYLNGEELVPKLFMLYLKSVTNDRFSEMLSFFYIWFWALFISYCIKTIISIYHAFSPSNQNIIFIAWIAIILEVLPIFLKIWQVITFDDAIVMFIVIYIPTIICFAIIFILDFYKQYRIKNLEQYN